MNIPNQLKIGGITYDVIYPIKMREDDLMAEISYLEGTIEINPRLKRDIKEQMFIHEMVHGILNCIGSDLRDDERFVDGFGQIFYQVLKENPGLFKEKEEQVHE